MLIIAADYAFIARPPQMPAFSARRLPAVTPGLSAARFCHWLARFRRDVIYGHVLISSPTTEFFSFTYLLSCRRSAFFAPLFASPATSACRRSLVAYSFFAMREYCSLHTIITLSFADIITLSSCDISRVIKNILRDHLYQIFRRYFRHATRHICCCRLVSPELWWRRNRDVTGMAFYTTRQTSSPYSPYAAAEHCAAARVRWRPSKAPPHVCYRRATRRISRYAMSYGLDTPPLACPICFSFSFHAFLL